MRSLFLGCGLLVLLGCEDASFTHQTSAALAPSSHDARLVQFEAPATMAPGERRAIRITVLNSGQLPSDAWTAGSYRLYSRTSPVNAWGVVSTTLQSDVPVGAQTTFTMVITALDVAGPANFEVQMFIPGQGFFGDRISIPITIDPAVRNRSCGVVTHNIPEALAPGSPFTASIEVLNNGAEPWPAGSCLYSRDSPLLLWQAPPCAPIDTEVLPGERYTVTFAAQAPAQTGVYRFERQLFYPQEGFIHASDSCLALDLEVSDQVPPQRDAELVSQIVPQQMYTGETKIMFFGMRNTGTEAWSDDGSYLLYSQTQPLTLWRKVHQQPAYPVGADRLGMFFMPVLGPAAPGGYDLAFRMFKTGAGGGFFGDSFSTPVTVNLACLPGNPTRDNARQRRVTRSLPLRGDTSLVQTFRPHRNEPLESIEVSLGVIAGSDPGAQVELRLRNPFDQTVMVQQIPVSALPQGEPKSLRWRVPSQPRFEATQAGCPPLHRRWEFSFSLALIGAVGTCEAGTCTEGQVGKQCTESAECEVDVQVGANDRNRYRRGYMVLNGYERYNWDLAFRARMYRR